MLKFHIRLSLDYNNGNGNGGWWGGGGGGGIMSSVLVLIFAEGILSELRWAS